MSLSHETKDLSRADHLKRRLLNQRELAEKIGSTPAAVSNWFRGLPPSELKQTQILAVMNEAGDGLGLDPLTGEDLWPN